MSLGSGVGSDSVKILIAGVEQLLGHPLQDAEKAMVADIAEQFKSVEDQGAADLIAGLKGVIDYAVEKFKGLKIVISVEPKA